MIRGFLWTLLYFFPLAILIINCLRPISFRIQKKRQTWLYILEIYYPSLFLTMIFTFFQADYFWLWNTSETIDTLLERFFICYGIYQIIVIVKRKLDNSADIDSYQSLKALLAELIVYKETENIDRYTGLLKDFRGKVIEDSQSMLNQKTLAIFKDLENIEFDSLELLTFLKIHFEKLDHYIQSKSFHWTDSFFLNLFK